MLILKPIISILSELIFKPLFELEFYKNSFPIERGLDHPNEISAYMFSEFFKAHYNSKTPFLNINNTAKINTEFFVEWIYNEMN